MVKAEGILRKMQVAQATPVHYVLPIGCEMLPMNGLVGREIAVRFTGTIFCIGCGKRTSRSFAQGYCFPCFHQDAPECSPCVIRPDLCRAHEGVGRNMDWEREHHLREHVVYLAWSGGLKVGVTRSGNAYTRWIDQGATRAIRLATTPDRRTAGVIERQLMRHVSDRTHWRNMLTGRAEPAPDLIPPKRTLAGWMAPEDLVLLSDDDTQVDFSYPVESYPERVTTVDLQADVCVSGRLAGIRGQYLMFADGRCLNIRKYQGFSVEIEC